MTERDLRAFFIGGEWVEPDSSSEFPVLNPATEERIGTIVLGNGADVNRAVAAAAAAFETYSRTTREERLALLHRLLEESEARLEDLARAMTAEMGAPITMSREAQADAAVGHLKAFIEALEQQEERRNCRTAKSWCASPSASAG